MSARYSADPVMNGLRPFQRRTVDHVIRRFFDDPDATRRFLVADETGLGKSHVARGVVARTVERLQDDPGVKRIDIVYVCSNADIARQNVQRIDVLKSGSAGLGASRLTTLIRHKRTLNGESVPEVGKVVNFVAFTPGTSLHLGSALGLAEERALLYLLIERRHRLTTRTQRTAAMRILRGGAAFERFEETVETVRADVNRPGLDLDLDIAERFYKATTESRRRFRRMVDAIGRRRNLQDEEHAHRALVAELRGALARASIDSLEPDLIILDEFQRFRHLLSVDDADHGSEAELANALFGYEAARVLLLSATPYKPFTYAEEKAQLDDHQTDLIQTLSFLASGNDAQVKSITDDLSAYRRVVLGDREDNGLAHRLRSNLTRLMCRTERPLQRSLDMLREVVHDIDDVTASDVQGFAALQTLADALEAPLPVEYWKSVPYFVNFGQDYVFGRTLTKALTDPDQDATLQPLVERVPKLDPDAVRDRRPIDPGNARMRHLVEETIEAGWWRLLWVPPACSYVEPGGPYAIPALQRMSKWLVFSSWAATPTALTALASMAARSKLQPPGVPAADGRFEYRMDGDRPGSMTTLALFWPAPGAADPVDPIGPTTQPVDHVPGTEAAIWSAVFARGATVAGLERNQMAAALDGCRSHPGDDSPLVRHIERALSAPNADRSDPVVDMVADEVARFGPGNIAWRCLGRTLSDGHRVTPAGRWMAAAVIADAVRRLFDRSDSAHAVDAAAPDTVYWRAVLRYCRWGNLESTLDEYLNHRLPQGRVDEPLRDTDLLELAKAMARAMTLREVSYEAFDPVRAQRFNVNARFAVRYGSKKVGDQKDENRTADVRDAFNSPFWPFILATTSVGQEGIDLHWWCRTAVHWNTPASPVDFEQREGRVHRYGGIAIRRNIADVHADEMRRQARAGESPWTRAYELAEIESADETGMSPYWVAPGRSRVERRVAPYILSRDVDRLQRLKRDLTLYRTTFGQARQEDILDLLNLSASDDATDVLSTALDLRPPVG